jgi:hypothetical protein
MQKRAIPAPGARLSGRDLLELPASGLDHSQCNKRTDQADTGKHQEHGAYAFGVYQNADQRRSNGRGKPQPGSGEPGADCTHAGGINFRSVKIKHRIDRPDNAIRKRSKDHNIYNAARGEKPR